MKLHFKRSLKNRNMAHLHRQHIARTEKLQCTQDSGDGPDHRTHQSAIALRKLTHIAQRAKFGIGGKQVMRKESRQFHNRT